MGVLPHMWTKRSPFGQNAHPLVYCPATVIESNADDIHNKLLHIGCRYFLTCFHGYGWYLQ